MRNVRHHIMRVLVMAMAGAALVAPAWSAPAITTDSRIKTLVYNPNDVFTITTHYGYQSNIEFGARETIETISVGDRVAWQISPAGRRLFIRAQEENAHTNMTVITNVRAYQFDLRSSSADAVFGSEELTYVVRFFYPEEGGTPPSAAIQPPPAPSLPNAVITPTQPTVAPAATPAPAPTGTVPAVSPFNYRYTFSGPNTIAPVKIFDDGKKTYFKFADAAITPRVAIITAKGESLDVPSYRTSDGLIAVNALAPRFSISHAGQQVVVYNEANGAM